MTTPSSTRFSTDEADIERVLLNPATSHWLINALSQALQRDPVDAANDAELLNSLLAKRCEFLLAQRQG